MFLPREAPHAPYEFPPVSPESHGRMILGVVGFFTSFATAVVILRLYVRTAILNTLAIDDYFMFFAMVSWYRCCWILANFRISSVLSSHLYSLLSRFILGLESILETHIRCPTTRTSCTTVITMGGFS